MGTPQVVYLSIVSNGLRDPDGTLFLNAKALADARKQVAIARDTEVRRKFAETNRLDSIRSLSMKPSRTITRFGLNSGGLAGQRIQPAEAIITDVALTVVGHSPEGDVTDEYWFGDIRLVNMGPASLSVLVSTRLSGAQKVNPFDGRRGVFLFPSDQEQSRALAAAISGALAEWRKRFPELAEP
jgi:hypothetical protein